MINGIKEVRLLDNLNLYMVNSKKFKTDLLGVYIKRPLDKSEAAMNTLLTRILLRSTSVHKTSKELNVYLEESYGMILVSDVVKYGEMQILQFKLQFPNKKHIFDKHIFKNALSLIKEIIFKPQVLNSKFNEDYFQQEKVNLIDEINSRVDDKMSYSLDRCLEIMYSEDPYSIYMYGFVEDVELITNEELYKHYKNVIKTSMIDICSIGDINFYDVERNIRNSFHLEIDKIVDCYFDKNQNKKSKLSVVKEKYPVKQGKLVMGYRTNVHFQDDLYEAAFLAFHMLGGGPNSKLFVNIREKESLCYYIFAKADKFKSCMVVGAGIKFEDYDKVVRLINLELEKLKNGEFSDELLDISRDAMISSFNSISDFPNSFINFYYVEILSRKSLDDKFSVKSLINKYKKITRKEIITAFNLLELDTIYFMEGMGESDECN